MWMWLKYLLCSLTRSLFLPFVSSNPQTVKVGTDGVQGRRQGGRNRLCSSNLKDMVFPKRQRRSRRKRKHKHKIDRISELPDGILLHIMSFMDTKQAVQTCLLSKRWKDLCKGLSNLTFYTNLPSKFVSQSFKKFMSWVMSKHDNSYRLLSLIINGWVEAELLHDIMEYAVFHKVHKLKINIGSSMSPNFESLPLIFWCESLTSLKISNKLNSSQLLLPKSLPFIALKRLHLSYVKFSVSDDDCAEPFSNCPVLDTLVLRNCFVKDKKRFFISNSTLSSLTIFEGRIYQIVLSTPNLRFFTITGSVEHQLSSACNLSFLEEVIINMPWGEKICNNKSSIIMRWLQVLSNVKILTIGLRAVKAILHDLSNSTSMIPQSPSFDRLELLEVDKPLFEDTSNEEVMRAVEYLLRNAPMARFDIITSS